MLFSFSLKHLWYLLFVASIVAFPETYIQRELRGGGSGGGGSSGGSSAGRNSGGGSSNECTEKNVTFLNADNSTGWKMTEDCNGSGMVAGIVIGGIFVLGGVIFILIYVIGKNRRKAKLETCEKSAHPLQRTSGSEMYSKGERSYRTNWLCDKCNGRCASRTDIPLYRCESCALDYCTKCEQTRSSISSNLELAAAAYNTGSGSGSNMRTVVPINA